LFNSQDGLHASHLTLSYDVDKKNVIIDLFKNEELIPNGHFVSYQSNGDKKIMKFSKTDIDLCHYHVSHSCYILNLMDSTNCARAFLIREPFAEIPIAKWLCPLAKV
jgi:hypothetical protein